MWSSLAIRHPIGKDEKEGRKKVGISIQTKGQKGSQELYYESKNRNISSWNLFRPLWNLFRPF
jgi:hypothetical protein